ncbi:MAG: PadR family transcriptional regulator [Gemmatimonadota bacterium]
MARIVADSLYGTLNLLILKALDDGQLHGLQVARRIQGASRDVLGVEEGALYPALHRLERDGLLRGTWGVSDKGRRAKFYELTAAGRKHLRREVERWTRHTQAVAQVLALGEAR